MKQVILEWIVHVLFSSSSNYAITLQNHKTVNLKILDHFKQRAEDRTQTETNLPDVMMSDTTLEGVTEQAKTTWPTDKQSLAGDLMVLSGFA